MSLEDFGTEKDMRGIKVNDQNPSSLTLTTSAIENKKEVSLKLSQWAIVGDSVYNPTSTTVKILPAGKYRIETSERGWLFIQMDMHNDDIIEFTDSIADSVYREIKKFWTLKNSFHKNGFLHRRGYLFYGPQGSGKSILVQQIAKHVVENGGIVIQGNIFPTNLSSALESLRKIEPFRPLVCLFEDIDALIQQHGEEQLLSFLDGDNELDYVLSIATTNYPERLDKRLVARPRRFDRIIKIDMPNKNIREEYLKKKFKIDQSIIDTLVEKTSGFSFAALADLVISVNCFEIPYEEAIKILKSLQEKKVSSEEFNTFEVGFGRNGNN